jgi:ABC-2 type transport system ATP-binding protein
VEPAICLKEVTKRYGSQPALERVTLEVPRGVVFALLGENGAGKTTSIRIALGLAEPDAGEATVLGLASCRQGLKIRQQVGYVSERPTLYDWMTVDEIGWFTAGFYPDGFLTRYRELVHAFKLVPQQKLKALSKGMRAKVGLALALGHDPELLILDEPTSGLDAIVRREFLESMVDRAAQGKTVFLSSHQIAEVERVADLVAILRGGQLLLVERWDTLRSQVREFTLVLPDGAAPPELGGEILSRRNRNRQWQILVRNPDEQVVGRLRNDANVTGWDERAPNLEEIFVAYMQREGSDVQNSILPVEDCPTSQTNCPA